MADFQLNENIAADTLPVADLRLCTVRLMRDANYPGWLLLVPRIAYTIEIVDLTAEHRRDLMDEITAAGIALRACCRCDKLNVATLGNVVSQIHVHVVARTHDDPAWPKPVWGTVPAKPFAPGAAEALAEQVAARLTRE